MKNSVTGYPGIGKNRELKYGVENYLKGDIFLKTLKEVSKCLRTGQWSLMSKNIRFIIGDKICV